MNNLVNYVSLLSAKSGAFSMSTTRFTYGIDDVLLLTGRHSGEDGKTNQSSPYLRSRGKISGLPFKRRAIVGVQMEWAPMDSAANPTIFKFLNKHISINV